MNDRPNIILKINLIYFNLIVLRIKKNIRKFDT